MSHQNDRTLVVVAGVEGTSASRAAMREAALAVRERGGVLHLVHAYDPRERFQHQFDRRRAPDDVAFAVCPRGQAEELLADEAHRIAGLGVRVVFHAAAQPAADALRDVAEELVADAIVIGSSRQRPRRFGIAARLQRDCPCELRIVVDGQDSGTRQDLPGSAWASARI